MHGNQVVMFGASGLAEIVEDMMKQYLGIEVAGYVINDEFYSPEENYGKNVIPRSEMCEKYPPEEWGVVLGFMVNDMYVSREKTYRQLKEWGYSFPNIIHPSAVVDTENLGEGNIIFPGVVIEKHCSVGKMNIFWPNVVLPHDNLVGDFCNLAPSVSFSGGSCCGSHCFIGNSSTLKNEVTVHDFGFVGANSYVSSDVMPYEVIVPQRSMVLEGKKSTDMGF